MDQWSICSVQGQHFDSIDRSEITVTVGKEADTCVLGIVNESVRSMVISMNICLL